jgi:hypothetical protein
MLTVEKLRKPLTRTESLNRLLELLTSLGFDTTGWQEGRIQKTLVTLFTIMHSDMTEVVKALAEFGSNSYASGDALNEHSRSRFQNDKVPAVRTRGPIKLTSTASIPYTIQVGQLIASTDSGVRFRNLTEGTLPAGSVNAPSTLTLFWDALIAGAQGNVPLNAVNRLLTPLAGVTVANDAGTPWYTVTGADEESDELLRRRNETQWARLTVELVAESYENIALDAGAKKVKVSDQNPRGPGTIDVYSAAETDLLSVPEMEAIQLAFSERAFQTDAAWADPWPNNTSRVANRHPTRAPLSLTATLYHDPNLSGATIQSRAYDAMFEFLRKTPIGGWSYGPGLENVVTREDVVEVLQAVEGVRTVVTAFATMSVGTLALVVEGTWTFIPVVAQS